MKNETKANKHFEVHPQREGKFSPEGLSYSPNPVLSTCA